MKSLQFLRFFALFVFADPSATTPREDPFGIPTVFYLLLSHQRSSINPPIDRNLEELRGTQHAMVSMLV